MINAILKNLPTLLILAVGSLQILGYLTGIQSLRQLGQLSAAAPLPFVFSEFRGLETFSLDFTFNAETVVGNSLTLKMTPQVYSQFQGPYNRRNIYGAVLAYGPKLTSPGEKKLVSSVLYYGFCLNGPLGKMFATKDPLKRIVITTHPKAQTEQGPFREEIHCP
jgi:hypothetical protein